MNGRKPGPDKAALALLDPDGSFIERLRQDHATLLILLEALGDEAGEKEAHLAELRRFAHRLAGAAGTFGHDEIGEAAMVVEDCLTDGAKPLPIHSIDTALWEAGRLYALLDRALKQG